MNWRKQAHIRKSQTAASLVVFKRKRVVFFFVFAWHFLELQAQNLPLNVPVYPDYVRRQHLIDTAYSPVSFTVRPLQLDKLDEGKYAELLTGSVQDKILSQQKIRFRIMPASMAYRYNSAIPYGWGGGAAIPAVGHQAVLLAGVQVQAGPVSIQLYPQFHYAQNEAFEEYPHEAPDSFYERMARGVNGIDQPMRFGDRPIHEVLPGNSHLKVLFGGFAAGVSTENVWWGPARFQALLLGDNAPGFLHATLHTTKPVKTFLGHFEGQYLMGRLEGSGHAHFSDGAFSDHFEPVPDEDWRYFTGATISYSPKWFPGLSVGVSRTFQVYREDMENSFRSWVPLLSPLPKEAEGLVENVYKREDQALEVYLRWAIPKAHSEFYLEFLRNDHSLDWRDALLNPEHSRGYVLGGSKYVPMGGQKFVGISMEMTHTQNSINNILRWEGDPNRGRGIYDNYQVVHGLTNRGQVLGAGLGRSGNMQVVEISIVEGLKKMALQLERYARDQNFYNYAKSNGEKVAPWVDFAAVGKYENKVLDHLLLSLHLRVIHSVNYNFYAPYYNEKEGRFQGDAKFGFNSQINAAYLF